MASVLIQTKEKPLFDKLSAKEVTDLIVMVLLAYHMREVTRLENILQEAGQQNRWYEFWPQFRKAAENPEAALNEFTQFIMAQLDGGDFHIPR